MRRVVIAVVMVLVTVFGLPLGSATAYQVATSVSQAGQVVTGNTPSGWTWKITSTGQNTVLDTTSSPGTYAATSAMFTPSIATTAPMDRISTALGSCPGVGACTTLGTIKIDFSQPVTNPVLHFMGIGAQASSGSNGSIFHVVNTLSSSTPSGATLGAPSAGAANMQVTGGGTVIDAINYLASTSCGSMTTGATALSVCGSVPVVGTVTSLTLTTTAQAQKYAGNGTASSTAADAWGLLVTAPEDFGDAPASYDTGGAASNVVGDLKLGATIDADNPNVANATTSPNAVANGANANGTNGDGADEDALSSWPSLTTAMIGSSYAVTVPVSGASAAGQVCGWIDFNRSGAFDTGEKACTAFAAGATSATLTWTVPAATSAGMTYARLRAAYGAATMLPTGALDSGETEDYSVAVMPSVKITKVLASGSTGTFDLKANGTTLATGVGNGGTTGSKTVFNSSTYGTPDVTVSQDVATTAVPVTLAEANSSGNTRSYTTSYSCVDGTGANVGTGSTTSAAVTIPASTGTNGAAQTITCTFTNTQVPSIGLTKSVSSITDVNGNGQRDAGDKINYSFLVTNTGGAALTAVGVTDPKVTGISCPGTTLALGASMTCTAVYTITQADTDSGSVPNTATATGKAGTTNVSATSSVTTTIPANATLSLQKSVASVVDSNGDGVNDAGDKVNWTFKVTNTGNVTITTVAVSDPKAGAISCPATTLAPGAATTCTAAAYTISQAEGDAGVVTNTATATGKSPANATVTSNTSSTSTTLTRNPAATLTKSAAVTDVNGNGKTDLGDKIQWSFLVKNTGNVTLTSVAITDAKAGATTCPATTLAPGASTTCTATTAYTITQADVDAGSVTNTATAGATQPSGATITTAPSSTTTPVVQTSALQLTKSAAVTDVNSDGVTDLGDKITWSFVAKNTGTVTLNTLAISDPIAGAVTCTTTTLAPGAQTTCTATTQHTVTQTDVDNGVVSNTGTGTAKTPSGSTVTSNASSTATPVAQTTTLALAKSGTVNDVNGDGKTNLGDKINYSFLVTNTGTVTLTNLAISDAKAGATTCPVTTLAPGAQTTCTATTAYTITQADVDAGVVNNTATASAKNPGGSTVTSTPSSVSTPVNQVSALTLTKSAAVTDVDGDGKTDLGDRIAWSFLVKNTGTVTVTTTAISDPKAGATTCPVTTLAPGASTTCTATTAYTITQADVDAGVVTNTATATAKNPAGTTVTSPTSSTSTPVNQVSALTLTKSAAVTDVNGDGKTNLGDKIAWSFLVKNTGTVTVTTTAISDAKAGATTCPVTTLAPGASTTCTATTAYVISQADVDNGVVSNTATATGKNPANVTVTSNASQTDTPVNQAPALQLTKSAAVTDVNGDGKTNLGDKIAWSFLVKNTGTVTLNALAISDTKAGGTTCPVTTLAPGASTTCTATTAYVITQADVDAGVVNNTATSTAKNPAGATVTSNSSSTSTTVARTATLQLTKSAAVTDVNGDGSTNLGDTITWSFLVKNTGTTTISTIAIADAKAGAASCLATTLSPGATTTCTSGAYTITQTDVDNGVVSNIAAASGKDPGGATVTSNTSQTDTPVAQTSALQLTKSAAVTDVNANGKTDLGDKITWSFLVKNTGSVTVSTVAVADPTAGAISCPATTLVPGASTTCTSGAHTITQAEVDAGVVNNTATATGKGPTGTTVTSNPSSTSTPVAQTSSLQLTKSAAVTDVNADGKTNLGDKITWSFLVKNTGTVTETSVAVTDPTAGAVTCPATTLAPGVSTTCTSGAHTITQAEVDAGVVNNTATATGKNPANVTVTSNASSTSTPVNQVSALQLTKSASVSDVNANGKNDLGDKIQWTFLVKNTGTVTVTTAAVSDAKAGAITCPTTTLAPGASTNCAATTAYTITQTDVDAGVVNNTATATGKNPANATVTSNASSTSTPVNQTSTLQLTKTAAVTDVNGNGATDLGDRITWSFLVKNTGTVTLTTVAVSDPTAGAISCPATTLAPGASTTCTSAAHTITQAEVDAGVVSNTATASGKSPSNATVTSNPSSTATPVGQTSSLLLTKTAAVTDVDGDGATDIGDTVTWSFLVKNTGNVTVNTVAISDPTAGSVTCPSGSVAPGASVTCTSAPHTIVQADVDAGVVSNTAIATAKSPAGATVTSNSSHTDTPVSRTSNLKLVKKATVTDVDGDFKTDLGDTIAWTFQLTNTGTTTISTLAVNDPKAGAISCPTTTLAPGASTTCTSAAHTITQAEVDAGVVNNTASATGTDAGGATVTSNPSSTSTTVAQTSTLQLTKSAAVTDVNANGKTDLGDTIAWSFLVKNTGTTTLTTAAVSDAKAGAISCPATTLAPGASTTCTSAAYTITQPDVDAGVVNNTATATAKSPSAATVTSSPSSTSTPVVQTSSLQLTKSAAVTDVNGDGNTNLGDKITWSFLVKNTGTVTIAGLAVSDATAGSVTCPVTTLAPGASTTCTSSAHTVTQADVDAGVVSNTATASGTRPSGASVTSNPSSTDTTIAQTSGLQLTKSAAVSDVNSNGKTDLGDTVTWSFLVKNVGTTTITSVTVNDPTAGSVTCPVTTLAPGASTTCTSSAHTITQTDVDAGAVTNTATASGKGPNGSTVNSNPSSTNTPVAQANSLLLTKSAATTDVDGDFLIDKGDKVQWSFLVKNTGTGTLTGVAVTDPTAGAVSCPVTTLAPGASTTCTATTAHVISQADVDAGVVNNTATARGFSPSGATINSNSSSTSTPVNQVVALQLTKSAAVTDGNSNGKTDLGDTITWTFLVQNTGTVTASTVAVTDAKAGAVSCPATTLAPGASTTCTAAGHVITQADVDAGVVSNTATAAAKSPSGSTINAAPSSTDTPVAQTPALQLTKSAAVTDVNSNGKTDLGDKITWTFLVKNSGSVTVTSVAVTDAKAGAVSCPSTTLAPGAATTCTAVAHTITQAEVDMGVVSNTATATGKSPSNATITSNTSQTDTPIAQASTLQLTKSAAVTDVNGDGKTNLGDKVTWSFLVKNTGSVTLTTVGVNDPTAGSVSCPATTLAPGASTTCTAAAHTITQADVDAGSVSNTATASGTSPSNATVTSAPSSTNTPVVQTATMTLTKTASVTDVNGNFKIDLGDRITWSLLVKNTGTTTINTVAVSDPNAGPVSCPQTTLAPGASTTCTAAAHTVTQADVDAGIVSNTATASAKDPQGNGIASAPSTADTPIDQSSGLQLTKTALVTDVNSNGKTDLGDKVTWSFLVKNTGTVSVTTVAVNDPKAGAVSCPATSLAPGASTSCTSTPYTITQSDVDAGAVTNTATSTAKNTSGVTVTSNSSSTTTPVVQAATLQLTKSAAVTDVNANGATDLGDKITWSFVVKNTGTTTMTAVAVSDATAGAVTCPGGSLAPGASTTCTSSAHVVSQADVDAGVVSNTATATAKNPSNATITSNPSSTDTTVAQASGLQLTKSAAVTDVNGNGRTDLGDTITWTFLVKNTGTVTVTTVVVNDPKAGAVACPTTTLAPGASTSCTSGAYTITQPDVDAAHVANTATASARTPSGAAVTSAPSSTDTPVAQSPGLALTKSASTVDTNGDFKVDLGDTITWSFAVRNTGTVTVSSLAITDPKAGAVSCPATTLAPGASTTCTSTAYAITQADVDAGVVSNTATAGGSTPTGGTVTSPPSSTDTTIAQSSGLSLAKSAAVTDVNGDGKTDLGDRITWSFLVRNTGTVTVTSVAVVDPKAGAVTCPATMLAPGASTTCTSAAYTITQPDVDAAHVTNTATASARTPAGGTLTSPPSSTDTPVVQSPSLALTKSSSVTDVNGDSATDLGDTITWSFLVQNTGTVSVSGLVVNDATAGSVTCPATTLAPGSSTTCTSAAHTVTQADVDAGVVSNTARASAQDPSGSPVTSPPSSADTPVAQSPALSLVKSAAVADVNGDGRPDLGDRISWTFTLTNSGTTTLTSPAVVDSMAGSPSCPVATLAPGASTTCVGTVTYTVTQPDVDAGHVDNTANATAVAPSGATVSSNPSTVRTFISQRPNPALTKTAVVNDVNGDGETDLGDTISWSFLVENTGNVTLDTIEVTDPIAGTVTCPSTMLAVGGSMTCTAVDHGVTQADVDNGLVHNTAVASGHNPSTGTTVGNDSSTDTPVNQHSTLSVVKSAAVSDVDGDGKTDLGDTITWSFLVQNTGTTTLTAVTVNDPKAGAVSCPATTLAPGASTTCTATSAYVVTQADVDAGQVTNTATASATDPGGVTRTSSPSSTTTPVDRSSSLSVVKSAGVTDQNGDSATDLGDRITWSFVVSNTGTSTLTGITVNDPTAGSVTCPVGSLAPGASTTCTATTAHVVTQADVDNGVVSNTATASATGPSPVTSTPSSTDTPVQQVPGLHLTKSATAADVDADGVIDRGDTVTWTFLVANTGTVTITSVAVLDPIAGAVSCPATTLAPGASTTCTAAAHVITQADVDAGTVDNTATASGRSPSGATTTSNPSSTSTPVAQAPAVRLTKSAAVTDADGDGKTDRGDAITWSFLVENTGTTTISTIAVADAKAGAVTCPVTTLAPGASTTCTSAAYPITQADVDAGVVSNTATATAKGPSGATVTSAPSSTDTRVDQSPAVAVLKSATVNDVNGDGRTDLGDRIVWSFLVTNTGTTSLSGVTINDAVASGITCPTTLLARGASTTCTSAAYTVTQADVDAGVVSNTATASATSPSGAPVTSAPSSTDTTVSQAGAVALTKAASVNDLNADGQTDLGDTVSWTFLVRNVGTTTIHGLAVNDAKAGPVTCPVATLAVGASTTCAATTAYAVSQADVDAGDVSNTATASATGPSGTPLTSAPSTTDTPVHQAPALTVAKSAAVTDVDGDGRTDLGDTVAWTFLVTNTGTTTVHALTVNDPTAGAVSCPVTSLPVGASTTCAATSAYVIGQSDVDAGVVSNTANAGALDPRDGPVLSPDSSTDTPVDRAPALTVVKSAAVTDVDADGKTDLGDTVSWTFVVTNTGTTTVTSLAVDDPTAGAVTCPVTSLAPGASTTCATASAHTVTQADVDAGDVSNTATARGRSAGSTVTSGPSSTDTPVAQSATLAAVKHAAVTDVNHDGKTGIGDRIVWTVTVTNTGTVSVHSLAIADPKSGPMTCAATTLAPGAVTTCTAIAAYTITQPDVDSGSVDNTATATGADPGGAPVSSPPATVSTPVVSTSTLSLVKQASVFDVDGDHVNGLGDTISWTFRVTNTGSTTLTGVAVDDPVAGAVTCPVTTLAPGAGVTCTAAAPHTVTQSEVDQGDVTNTATAQALDPSSTPVTSAPSSTDTELDQLAQIRLVKHGVATDVNGDGLTDAGDTILWTFDVTNTGRVTLNQVDVNDTRAGPVTCQATTLAVGASTTCTSTTPYVITAADATAGAVHNVATATGSCGCRAAVKAVKAAAMVATKRTATKPPTHHPVHPSDPVAPIVPGLPYTGAMGVAWAVRGGLAALVIGAFLLVVTRRRDDEDAAEGGEPGLA